MKQHWLLLSLIALAFFLVAGCPEQQPETAETGAAAAATTAEPDGLAVDPDKLPPPRPALDTAPDLSDAKLVVNAETLGKMNADAVPPTITDQLANLQGREFSNAAEFEQAVRDALGSDADAYMDRIMRNALVVGLADAPPAPQGELSIAEREQQQAAAVAAQPMSTPSAEFGTVYFDFDKSNIKPEFAAVIRDNARILLDNPDMQVTIEGHCDERGTNEYNLALGQRRAEAVRQALIAEGVSAGQVATVSYGEERPVALGHDEDSWWQNRRGVLVIN